MPILEQTLNQQGQDYFKAGVLLVGNTTYANYITDGVDDQVQLQQAIDQALTNISTNPSLPSEVRIITKLNVNAVGTYTETLGGVTRRLAVRLRDNVRITIASGVTISFGSGGNSGFNGGTVFTSVFGNFGNLTGARVICEGLNAFDGLSTTSGVLTDRHSAIWLDARSNSCTTLQDCLFVVSGRRTAGDLIRTYNSNTSNTSIAKNINFDIIDSQNCHTGGFIERNGEGINVDIYNISNTISDGFVYKDGVENSTVTIKRIAGAGANGLKVFIDPTKSGSDQFKFNNIQVKGGNIENSTLSNMYIAGMDGTIEASVFSAQRSGIFFDTVSDGGIFYYPKKLVLVNPIANNNNLSAGNYSGIEGIVKNLEIIGFQTSDTQTSATQYRGINFTEPKNDYITLTSGKAENNTNSQIEIVGVNSYVSPAVLGFNPVYTVPASTTYTIATPHTRYLLNSGSVLKFPKFSDIGTNLLVKYQVRGISGSSSVQASQENDLSYKPIDTLSAGVAFPVALNQSFGFVKDSDKWSTENNSASIADTFTNKTLSTGTKLDANADENFTLYGQARQAIINGNFDQVGLTGANPANGASVVPYWNAKFVNTGTLPTTITHSTFTMTSGDLAKAFNCYRISPNGSGSGFGSTNYYAVTQDIINGTRNLAGLNRKITVSFWARSSITNKKIGVYAVQKYGTGGSPSANETINGAFWTLTSTLTRYTYTFTTNTLVGKTFGTNSDDVIEILFPIMWGTGTPATNVGNAGVAETFVNSGNIDISEVAGNSGDVALPFQPNVDNKETYKVKAWRTGALALPAATYTTIVFDNEVQDTQNIYNTSTGVFTAPVTGEYLLTGHIGLFSTSARDDVIALDINGTETLILHQRISNANAPTAYSIAQQITLTAGQYIRVQGYTSLAGEVRPGKNLVYVQFALLSY